MKVHGVFLFTRQTGRLADQVAKHPQTAVVVDMSPRDEASARSRPGESIVLDVPRGQRGAQDSPRHVDSRRGRAEQGEPMSQTTVEQDTNNKRDAVQREVSAVMARARSAQAMIADYTQEQVDDLCTAVAWAVARPERAQALAKLAVDEGGFGNYDDKVTKINRRVLGYSPTCARCARWASWRRIRNADW